jgi:amino-acid N-acetyltransferase
VTAQAKGQAGVMLRPATPADLAAIRALLQRSGLPIVGVDSGALSQFIVAEDSEALVGVVGLEIYGESALLRSVTVEERWRGTGVGRSLIDAAVARSRERGINELYLLTTTAEHYFPRFGFACIDRGSVPAAVQASAEFQGACPDSAVAMRKAVSG